MFKREQDIFEKRWFKNFKERHTNLALKPTIVAKAKSFHHEVVNRLYVLSKKKKKIIVPKMIFDMDETGVSE